MKARSRALLFVLVLIPFMLPVVLHAQDSRTSLGVYSLINVEPGEVVGECHTDMQGDTDSYYAGVGVSSCDVHLTANTNINQSCADFDSDPSASCVTAPLETTAGSTYQTQGQHTIIMYPGDGFACETTQYQDSLDYAQASGANCGSEFCAYPLFPDGDDDSPPCFGSDAFEVAFSASNTFTPIDISPQGVIVHSKGTQPFTSNGCPSVTWSAVLGTITQPPNGGCGGLYTAPTVSTGQSGEVDTITVKSNSNPQNAASTTLTLLSVGVTINPFTTPVNQGQTQTFTASVDGCDTNCVTWTASAGSIDKNSGLFTAPTVTATQIITITATSTTDTTVNDMVQVQVDPVTISFPFVPPFVALGQTQLSVIVNNLHGNPPPTCTWTATAGSFTTTSCTSATYIPPIITVQTIVTVNVCVSTNPPTCSNTSSPLTLTLVPPVLMSLSGAFDAGQPNNITINGSGFGSAPAVSFSDPGVTFTYGTRTNNQITLTVTIPVETAPELLTVFVTDTTAGIGVPPGSASVNTTAVTLGVNAVTPGSVTLVETQTQQFSGGGVTCKSAGGFPCTGPTSVWSITSSIANPGSITQTGFYTAPSTGVIVQTAVSGKVCASGTATCATFSITLQAISVSVSPSSATLNSGGQQQFTGQALNSPNPAVNWQPPSAGSITSTGLYTAPNPITATQTISITACSVVDAARCGSASVKLQAPDFTVAVTPSAQTILYGGSTTYTVSVSPLNGFTGSVTLALTSGLPAGATYNFSLTTLSGGSGSSTLTVFGNTAHAGSSQLVVTGTSGSLSHPANPATLAITDFTLSASPASQTAFVGGSTTYTVTVAPLNGFTGNVTLSVAVSGKGPIGTFSLGTISSGSGSSTLTVFVPTTTAPGAYTLTISGVSGNVIHTAAVTLNVPVPDFTVSANNPWFVGQGGSMTSGVVTITPQNGFTGIVALTLSWNYNPNPPGLTGGFSPQTITGSGNSTLTFTSSASTPSTVYYPVITATSGTLTHVWYGTLQVYAAWNSINWLSPSSGAGWGPPNTMSTHGIASHGTGTVTVLWNDTTLGTGWQTISPPLVPDTYGNYWATIPSNHYCHSFSAESIYVGVTSPVFTYTGQGSSYCTLNIIWIQPEALAGYGPPGSLIVAGSAVGAPSGTAVTMWWRDVTANGPWTNGGAAVPASNNIWLNAIPSVNYGHQYAAYVTYDGINTSTDTCTYAGNNKIVWCP